MTGDPLVDLFEMWKPHGGTEAYLYRKLKVSTTLTKAK